MNEKKTSGTVFVGLSGGVDSSVAAVRLIASGYTVVGVFIKVWHPDFLECNWEQERTDAMRVAAKLGIPFLTCDAQQVYKDAVASYFIDEYKNGRTPNPDVMCNKHVKFGAFLDFALQHGADFVATGHYAQHVVTHKGHTLLRGVDTSKDQSYFLWTLTQAQLAKVLLPIGDSSKVRIREEAARAALTTAQKKDSQGICFLGHIDIADFLSHYMDLKNGIVLDEQGNEIGTHKGAIIYTQGQRQGFTITTSNPVRHPYYVTTTNAANNTIVVSTKKPEQEVKSSMTLTEVNYIAWQPQVGETIEVQTRYRQKPTICTITDADGTNTLTLQFTQSAEQVSSGQSCVLYSRDVCCGGGIIRP